MTDLEILKALFDRSGVKYVIEPLTRRDVERLLRVEADSSGVIGHTGFFAEFYFDMTGKLLRVGIWE